jgi:hypothetical protein
MPVNLTLRQSVDLRLTGMDSIRESWLVHWRELADYILPRRYRWLVTNDQYNRGSPINGRIIDNTATRAARTLAAGIMAGTTNPSKPWFKLRIAGVDHTVDNQINRWLAEVERRILRVMAESNFYNSMALAFTDLSVFNSAAMLIYEDYEDVIRCYNPCLGEYYLANGPRMNIEVFYRKFTRTVQQIVQEFGIENCSLNVKNLYEQSGASLNQEIILAHAIEPNDQQYSEVDKSFKFRECYWEWGQNQSGKPSDGPDFLRVRGFHELPGVFLRWEISGNDPYGRGPSMDALGDTKQLQQEQKRKAQALDKLVNPPVLADVTLKNQPMSLLPGGTTFVPSLDNSKGVRPIYQVNPPIREIMEDIAQVQRRIGDTFFNDLFMMFQNMQAEPRSAAAIDARREEKLIMLGPVLERLNTEGFDPGIDRIFNIMNRSGLIPPPPQEIQDQEIQINYVSMLAEAQRAASTIGIERSFAFAGNLAAVKPDVLDNYDFDEGVRIYGDLMSGDPRILKDIDVRNAERAERAKQEQALAQMQMTDAAVNAGKTLSETNVGGGVNALEAIIQ